MGAVKGQQEGRRMGVQELAGGWDGVRMQVWGIKVKLSGLDVLDVSHFLTNT